MQPRYIVPIIITGFSGKKKKHSVPIYGDFKCIWSVQVAGREKFMRQIPFRGDIYIGHPWAINGKAQCAGINPETECRC